MKQLKKFIIKLKQKITTVFEKSVKSLLFIKLKYESAEKFNSKSGILNEKQKHFIVNSNKKNNNSFKKSVKS